MTAGDHGNSRPVNDPRRAAPRLAARRADGGIVRVGLSGDWLNRAALPNTAEAEREFAAGGVQAVEFETAELGRWDSALLVRLLAIQDAAAGAEIEVRSQTLPSGLARLMTLAQSAPGRPELGRSAGRRTFLDRFGETGLAAWTGGKALLSFLGESVVSLLRLLRGNAQFRGRDLLEVIEACGPRALGIVALINFLIGLILAFVGAAELARFGASIYTADLVAVATVRELGCIMTGIILCGRTGAAFAARLGAMKVNQEIEALETFGISPFEFLVLPRMLALILMMPLLVLFADLIAIGGGFLVSVLMLDVGPQIYLQRTVEAITLSGFLLGVIKGAFFGVMIALTGCLRGLQCGPNAAAVGLATTSAVVTGITWIIASDGVFAVICNALQI